MSYWLWDLAIALGLVITVWNGCERTAHEGPESHLFREFLSETERMRCRHVERPWGLNGSEKGLRNSTGSVAQRNCSHPNEQPDLNTASLQNFQTCSTLTWDRIRHFHSHWRGLSNKVLAKHRACCCGWGGRPALSDGHKNHFLTQHIHSVITSCCLCNLLWKGKSRRGMMERWEIERKIREPTEWCI